MGLLFTNSHVHGPDTRLNPQATRRLMSHIPTMNFQKETALWFRAHLHKNDRKCHKIIVLQYFLEVVSRKELLKYLSCHISLKLKNKTGKFGLVFKCYRVV